MNAETEKILEQLIVKHGLKTVRKHLEVLITGSKWSDWQQLDSAVTNAANRLNRKHYADN
jgi:hypothetical protein